MGEDGMILDTVSDSDVVTRVEVTLTENFGKDTNTKWPLTPNSNAELWKKTKQ